MILAAMTAEQRSDVISHISTSSLKMLYRLHTDYTQYQPGGSHEAMSDKTFFGVFRVLRMDPMPTAWMGSCLRSWPRWRGENEPS